MFFIKNPQLCTLTGWRLSFHVVVFVRVAAHMVSKSIKHIISLPCFKPDSALLCYWINGFYCCSLLCLIKFPEALSTGVAIQSLKPYLIPVLVQPAFYCEPCLCIPVEAGVLLTNPLSDHLSPPLVITEIFNHYRKSLSHCVCVCVCLSWQQQNI